ncbi:RnfABCDGE type electron transport complex subunit G [Candidatus Acetatifactor stercoripullorum]|uniref:RnfABCDGE type electron transport complex subunit G n=1 Tax=Candidatus Acetatifactor stercoripullorum TaxID=2838414 RepID=UPI00298D8765|nr:RnfABCDGE type electron transport complex subunit G [Candidatus Acetatifactor stercoripullorum]
MKKNSDVNVMLKEAGILFAITLIAGLILGFVYELTKEPIRIQEEKAVQEACAQVFESAAQFAELPYEASEELALELAETGVEIGTVFQALGADGSLMGYVVQSTSTEGYGGDIVLYLGVTLDGTLNGISLLEISETPGLGMRAQEVLAPQFRGKQVSQFTYTKTGGSSDSEIDAISGATITTEAVTNAVNGGLKVAEALRQGGADNE